MTTKPDSESKARPLFGPKFRERWCREILKNSKIPPRHFKVATAISFHFNSWTGWAWARHETLAEIANVCAKTVARAINNLEKHQHLRVKRSCNGHRTGLATEFYPRFPAAERSRNGDGTLGDQIVHCSGQNGPFMGTEKSYQPHTEPHTEPHIPRRAARVREDGIRGSKEEELKGSAPIGSPSFSQAQQNEDPAIGEARKAIRSHYSGREAERGCALVGKYSQQANAVEILEAVLENIATDADIDELAHALWGLTK
jgi:hypothetical protein